MLVDWSSEGGTALKGINQITLTVNRRLLSRSEGKELRSELVLPFTECHVPSSVLGQRWDAAGCCSILQTGHITLSSTPDQQLENTSRNTTRSNHCIILLSP